MNFLKAILIFALLLTGVSASAGVPKIILLSSVSVHETNIPILSQFYKNFDRRMERVFRREIGKIAGNQNVEIDVINGADLHDAWVAMHSPENVAVFWLSHAGWASNGGAGLQNDDLIIDKAGYNIKKALETPDQNLQWLSVISCNSQKVLTDLKAQGYFSENKNLSLQGFDTKVLARAALKHSVRASREVLLAALASWNGKLHDVPVPSGDPLTIIRQTMSASPPVSIEVGGKVLGIFPQAKAGETQTQTVFVARDAALAPKSQLKIVFDTGTIFSPDQLRTDLGSFDFHASWTGAAWSLFQDADGHAIGVGTRIYRYTGK